MKVEITTPQLPELKAGQLWQHRAGRVYLTVPHLRTSEIFLLNLENHEYYASWTPGFAGNREFFTYIGDLTVTK